MTVPAESLADGLSKARLELKSLTLSGFDCFAIVRGSANRTITFAPGPNGHVLDGVDGEVIRVARGWKCINQGTPAPGEIYLDCANGSDLFIEAQFANMDMTPDRLADVLAPILHANG